MFSQLALPQTHANHSFSIGPYLARPVFVEDDGHYDYPCRIGLLAVAVLHWIIFALLVRGRAVAPATGESSVEELGHFASELVRALTGVA